MKNDYQQLGEEIGKLVDQKRESYGNSFGTSVECLKLLYPNGIQPRQFEGALLAARIFDKLAREAEGADMFFESPYLDIAGYAMLGIVSKKERESKECGSVSGSNAGARSTEPNDSAEPDASRPTTPNDESRSSPSSGPRSTEPPDSSSKEMDALAAERSSLAVVVDRAKNRNAEGLCVACPCEAGGEPLPARPYCHLFLFQGVWLWAHNDTCRVHFTGQASRDTGLQLH